MWSELFQVWYSKAAFSSLNYFIKLILGATLHENVFQEGGNATELLTAKIFPMKKIARIASVPSQSLGVMTADVSKDLSG